MEIVCGYRPKNRSTIMPMPCRELASFGVIITSAEASAPAGRVVSTDGIFFVPRLNKGRCIRESEVGIGSSPMHAKAQLSAEFAQIAARCRIVWIQFERSSKMFFGFGRSIQFNRDQPEAVM